MRAQLSKKKPTNLLKSLGNFGLENTNSKLATSIIDYKTITNHIEITGLLILKHELATSFLEFF